MGKRGRRRQAQGGATGGAAGGGPPRTHRPGARHHGPWRGDPRTAERLFVGAAMAAASGRVRTVEEVAMQLGSAWSSPGWEVQQGIAPVLGRALVALFDGGWQPADVVRIAGRRLEKAHASLAAGAIVVDADRYRHGAGAEPVWLEQLGLLDERRPPGLASGSWLFGWSQAESLYGPDAVRVAAEFAGLAQRLPVLEKLCHPPSAWGSATRPGDALGGVGAAASGIDPKVLTRIRALLAKAESTTFSEEADALMSKAQELIARHAVERVLLEGAGRAGPHAAPTGRRLGVDDPYSAAKSILLDQVARASRCQVVWSQSLGFSTVFGFPADLEAVEMLYTSLLVQATTAMIAAGSGPVDARYRTRSFRQSFLVAFATRIGERLRASAEAVVDAAAAEHGDLLPALRSRDAEVTAALAAAFPKIVSKRLSAADGAGWAAGHQAAELADLGPDRRNKTLPH